MKLKKLIVFVTVFGTMCRSEMMIKINEPDGFAELQEAAIQILTTCYASQDKTVALIGEFPGNFVKRLSSDRSFAVALVDQGRRAEKNVHYWRTYYEQEDWNKRYVNIHHELHLVVIMATHDERFAQMIKAYEDSPYYTRTAHLLVIGWSSVNEYAVCDSKLQTYRLLYKAIAEDILGAKLLCRNRKKEIVIYDVNPFRNQAPEPWESVNMNEYPTNGRISYFVREYRKHEEMCKNLDYDKTHDLGGAVLRTTELCDSGRSCWGSPNQMYASRRIRMESKRHFTFIANFLTYVNATRQYLWKYNPVKGVLLNNWEQCIVSQPFHLNGVVGSTTVSRTHGRECKYLVSQFRGNKSQLQKIISTIDSYSWIGIGIIYVITWIFFTFFMHQPILDGLMNLCRLSCNCGITTAPVHVSSRIYFGCLLFFVLTMQGIFVGNLASLLTHDVPVRQIDTINDLVDLGYKVYAYHKDFVYFSDFVLRDRLIAYVANEDCIPYIQRDPSAACLTWGAVNILKAANTGLHVSQDCFKIEYLVTVLPWKFVLETTFDKYLRNIQSADIMLELDALVDEKRLLEAESAEVSEEPEVMILSDLGFAFVIFGIGFGCSVISFVIEIVIDRLHRRVIATRVIVL